MNKTKLIILSFTLIVFLSLTGIVTYIYSQPKKDKIIKNSNLNVISSQSNLNLEKKTNFQNAEKNSNSNESINYQDNSKSKKFTDAAGMPIKETDLNNYSKGRDESLIYYDDFIRANCETYILAINSPQNCYITFKKEISESQLTKVKASIMQLESFDDLEESTSVLNCKTLSIEQNPNKNTISCSTDNLKLKSSGTYNLTLVVADDIMNNALEKNIEVLTVDKIGRAHV